MANYTRKVYVVRYEDSDVEFCSFYCNQADAMKGRTNFKRKFGKLGSIEPIDVDYTKRGFIKTFDRYSVKYRERK